MSRWRADYALPKYVYDEIYPGSPNQRRAIRAAHDIELDGLGDDTYTNADAFKQFGALSASKIVYEIMHLPVRERGPAMEAIFNNIDPTLGSRVNVLLPQFQAKGQDMRQALQNAIAKALTDGVYKEVIGLGYGKRNIPQRSVLGLAGLAGYYEPLAGGSAPATPGGARPQHSAGAVVGGGRVLTPQEREAERVRRSDSWNSIPAEEHAKRYVEAAMKYLNDRKVELHDHTKAPDGLNKAGWSYGMRAVDQERFNKAKGGYYGAQVRTGKEEFHSGKLPNGKTFYQYYNEDVDGHIISFSNKWQPSWWQSFKKSVSGAVETIKDALEFVADAACAGIQSQQGQQMITAGAASYGAPPQASQQGLEVAKNICQKTNGSGPPPPPPVDVNAGSSAGGMGGMGTIALLGGVGLLAFMMMRR